MKNTKKRGELRYLIYEEGDNFVGVCFELGLVEQEKSKEKVLYRLKNGTEAVIKTINENKLDESHINKKVHIKYYFYWYFSFLLKIKDLLVLENRDIVDFRKFSFNCV